MSAFRVATSALIALAFIACLSAPVAVTRASDATDSVSTPSNSAAKEQRKASRKAARVKKNAELKDLQRNGF